MLAMQCGRTKALGFGVWGLVLLEDVKQLFRMPSDSRQPIVQNYKLDQTGHCSRRASSRLLE